MTDPLLQNAVRRQANDIFDAFGFEIVVNVGIGEGGVASEIDAGDVAFVGTTTGFSTPSQPSALWT